MKYDIIGVGDTVIDYLYTVEKYPEEDNSAHILSVKEEGGGVVGTSVFAAAHLGSETAVITQVGYDEVGDHIIEGLKKEGIDISGIRFVEQKHSPVSYILVNIQNGSRTIMPYRDVFPPIAFDFVHRDMIRNAKILHTDTVNFENSLNAARIMKEAGGIVSVDACSVHEDPKAYEELWKLTDILITNEAFPERVAGSKDLLENLRYFASFGPKTVITTMGDKGCVLLENNALRSFPAYKVNVRDTTGAGDVFHGAFLHRYAKGETAEDCIRFASAASALKCTRSGGRSGIPSEKDVFTFMKEYTVK